MCGWKNISYITVINIGVQFHHKLETKWYNFREQWYYTSRRLDTLTCQKLSKRKDTCCTDFATSEPGWHDRSNSSQYCQTLGTWFLLPSSGTFRPRTKCVSISTDNNKKSDSSFHCWWNSSGKLQRDWQTNIPYSVSDRDNSFLNYFSYFKRRGYISLHY
jgi:hypothetical protein